MTCALFSYSCIFSIRGILSTLRDMILRDVERERYRTYVADCLWAIAKNTANGFGGTFFEERYSERGRHPKEDHRTGDEIAADIIARAGLEVISE